MTSEFRKKPVVIQAVQWTGDNRQAILEWVGVSATWGDNTGLTIRTLEGDHHATVGDWIIRGVKGEFYPCKPDIFAATYEPVEVLPPVAPAGDREAVAEEIVEGLFKDIRGRKVLKWFFDPAPDRCGPICEHFNPIDLDVQGDISAAWRRIVVAALSRARTGSEAQ